MTVIKIGCGLWYPSSGAFESQIGVQVRGDRQLPSSASPWSGYRPAFCPAPRLLPFVSVAHRDEYRIN